MKRRLFISLFVIFIIAGFTAKSQLYVGGSRVYAQISESGQDDVTGFSFDVQGEFKLAREKLSFIPTVRLAVMDSKIYDPANPFYIKNFSFSPLIAYKLVEFKGFSISPYAGPFLSRLQGRRAPSAFFPAGFIDDTRFGAEFGVEFKLKVYDYFTLKLNPINLLFGNEYYRQGNINVMINF